MKKVLLTALVAMNFMACTDEAKTIKTAGSVTMDAIEIVKLTNKDSIDTAALMEKSMDIGATVTNHAVDGAISGAITAIKVGKFAFKILENDTAKK